MKTQLQQGGLHKPQKGYSWINLSQVTQKTIPLKPAIFLRLRAQHINKYKKQPKCETKIIFQMKTETLSRNKNLNEMKSNNLTDAGFKMIILKMLKELRGKMDELSKSLNKQ